jgi:hypothetical protein
MSFPNIGITLKIKEVLILHRGRIVLIMLNVNRKKMRNARENVVSMTSAFTQWTSYKKGIRNK